MTDRDRRQIITMLGTGMDPQTISDFFGYTLLEIESAKAADFITGRPSR